MDPPATLELAIRRADLSGHPLHQRSYRGTGLLHNGPQDDRIKAQNIINTINMIYIRTMLIVYLVN